MQEFFSFHRQPILSSNTEGKVMLADTRPRWQLGSKGSGGVGNTQELFVDTILYVYFLTRPAVNIAVNKIDI